jgi:biopolymer transport protein ExbD
MSRRKKKPADDHDSEPLDLDLTPFLNILFMLILAILAMTSWTQMSMLNVQAPQISGGGGGGDVADPLQASALNLTVFVLKDGFNIGASGATLDGNAEGRSGQPYIPMVERTLASGAKIVDYNVEKLQQKLLEFKRNFKQEESMILSADGNVSYDVIVRVMDAARKTKDNEVLFPAVAFAAGVVG